MPHNPPIELPEKYYLNYFEYVLRFVQEKCGNILIGKEKEFIKNYEALSEDARCLFIRFANRRGCFFRLDKINYTEISDLRETIHELTKNAFVAHLDHAHQGEIEQVLHIFTRQELLELLKLVSKELHKASGKLKKPDLITFIASQKDAAHLLLALAEAEPVIRIGFDKELEMIKFLFFGSIHGDMTQFVVRDIGYLKTEAIAEDKLQARFKTRKEAEDKLMISKIYDTYKILQETQTADQIYQWFIQLNLSGLALSEAALTRCDKFVLSLGKLLEQHEMPEAALHVYQHTEKPPSRERQVRLLCKLKQEDLALELAELISENPKNADEQYFAEDFLNRLSKNKRIKSTTRYLKDSPIVELNISARYAVEIGVLEYYFHQGKQGAFTENYLWRSLFGLVFWDIIFDPDSAAMHNPLQTVPSDFYSPAFYTKRKLLIHDRLHILSRPRKFKKLIEKHFEEKMGTNNPMVAWYDEVLPLIFQCHKKLAPHQLGSVLTAMAKNPGEHIRGFPDLFIWDKESYSFIEVKSPNDHLSAQQLYWLHFFEKQKIKAKVVRVKWIQD